MDTKKPILVSGGIIRKDGKILIAQRKKDSRLEPNKWEFPGGKVELYEDPKNTLIREIKEELDIEIKVDDIFEIVSHIYEKDYEKYHIILHFYMADYVSGDIKLLDCQDVRFIDISEFSNYEFARADLPVIEKLKRLNC